MILIKTALLLLCSIVAVESRHWIKMNSNLLNRVIHVESLRYRGHWVDAHHSKWAKITGCPARDVYFKDWTSFKVVGCGNDVCLESLRYPHYYWDAHHSKHMRITHSYYPSNKIWFKWSIYCTSSTMQQCRFYTPRYNQYLDSHHSGYAKVAGYGDEWSRFRILAPKSTHGYKTIYSTTNNNPTAIKQTIKYTERVTSSTTTTFEITSTLSAEITAVFKVFSPTISASITSTLRRTTTNTHSKGEELTYELNIPPFSSIAFQQLQGYYDPFTISTRDYRSICTYTKTNRACSASPKQIG